MQSSRRVSSRNKRTYSLFGLILAIPFPVLAQVTVQRNNKPMPTEMPPAVIAPKDIAYPGVIRLRVDATDVQHRVYLVRESIPVRASRELTLLFPQWTQGDHAPNGPLEKMAGLVITVRGQRVRWVRDAVSAYAFHIKVPYGATMLEVQFNYLGSIGSATGPTLITPTMLDLQWQSAVLYPAGYYSRGIAFKPSVVLPSGWTFYSALDGAERSGDVVDFGQVNLENLVDSPVMAGKYGKQIVLSTDPVRVSLDVVADDAGGLARLPEAAEQFKHLQDATINLFGGRHYAHYDHMLWLSDSFGPVYYEHRQSGENSRPGDLLKAGPGPTPNLGLMEHGFIHSWNGMYRRPADMWTANLNTPERDSMLWVFEGLTEYWSDVLQARAGLSSQQDSLNGIAKLAAFTQTTNGAQWRTLEDVNNDPTFAFRKTTAWPSWQRDMYDAYSQGELIWLSVDIMLRQQTGGKRSLDDFARSFFGAQDGRTEINTYTFDDMVRALNKLSSYDWSAYLHACLDEYGTGRSLNWIGESGYKLDFVDKGTPALEAKNFLDLAFSIGMQVANGRITALHWQGPAYQAGLISGGTIVSVNGLAYDPSVLEAAVKSGGSIHLVVKRGGNTETYVIEWQGGLRQPALIRLAGRPDVLGEIFRKE